MRLPSPDEILIDAGRAVRRHGRVALCQIVRAEGSTPGKVGWKLVVPPVGECRGNLGGGSFEALVTADARTKLADPAGAAEVKRYYLTEEATRGEPTGMVCGGFAEVLIEVISQPPLLVICGGGPVGQALARNAALCDLEIRVVEDRDEFRRPELFPEDTSFVAVGRDFAQPFLDPGDRPQMAVIVTRCWETDLAALASVLRQTPSRLIYLGLMGSARKVGRVRAEVTALGLDADAHDLRAPIGLPIGGDTPAEIAVSILAEIIQATRDRARGQRPRAASPTRARGSG